jgi:hypothetical protein
MKKFERFMRWYLGTSDQEIQATYEALGRMVAERLVEEESFKICIQDLVRQSDMSQYFEWIQDQ